MLTRCIFLVIFVSSNKKVKDMTTKEDLKKQLVEVAEFLIRKSVLHDDIEMHNKAVELIGQEEVTLYKIKNNLQLWRIDSDCWRRMFEERIERLERILS